MVNNDNGNTIAKLRKGKDMTEQEILEFIRRNPVFALATAEEGRPHVRYMMLYRADEEGLIFNTGENKDFLTSSTHIILLYKFPAQAPPTSASLLR